MATAKKSVRKNSVKKATCTCGCGCCADSVKYTGVWAAWHAFWRRGYTEWAGTSSRSEYWLSWIGNLIVFILGSVFVGAIALVEAALFGHTLFLTWCAAAALAMYAIAWVIPAISMMTRRMHDAGLSAWIWLLYAISLAPAWSEEGWVYGPSVGLIIALLPTQVNNNPYHKNNK